MRTRLLALAAAVPLALGAPATGLAHTGPATQAATATSASNPCGTVAKARPHYQHVIWIWMENHSFNTIIGNPQAPYINSLASQCGLAANYHNVTHPSLPNYIAATSGLPIAALAPFLSDCNPTGTCLTSAPSIFGQGETWKSYDETMPSNCFGQNFGEYAVRHNPAPYYTTLQGCSSFDVPYTQLPVDLADGTLPAFSFITPNVIDDMHDGTVPDGDNWLAGNLPAILNSPEYENGSTAVFITWDEGEGGTSNTCATNTTDVGCRVATLVISPSTVAGSTSGRLFNHYSLLGTAEQLLKLPKLGQAADFPTMIHAFHL